MAAGSIPAGVLPHGQVITPALQDQLDQMLKPGKPQAEQIPTLDVAPLDDNADKAKPARSPLADTDRLTRLEEAYAKRAGEAVRLFGYESFARPAAGARQTGAIQEDYVLGPGDEIAITLYGKEKQAFRVRVDREGRFLLPGVEPVPAAGMPFGQFRDHIQTLVRSSFVGTDATISLASIRQISVILSGDVARPGYTTLNGLSTVMDGLVGAAGILRSGSLRSIKLLRQNSVEVIDLYPMLLGTANTGLPNLAEGDVVNVPLLGRTAAVVGRVKRPGIYELPPGESAMRADQLLELAGGQLVEGAHRYRLLRVGPDGGERFVELADIATGAVGDGDILFVEPVSDVIRGVVFLDGHVRQPGRYPLQSAKTVNRMLGSPESVLAEPYLPFAVRQYVDPRTQVLRFQAFDLGRVMTGQADIGLGDADRVIVLGLADVAFLSSPAVVEALAGKSAGSGCRGIDMLARNVRANPRGELASSQFTTAIRNLSGGPEACPAVFNRYPNLLTFLITNSVVVRGNVLKPGVYPAVDASQSADVLAIAGALGRMGDGDGPVAMVSARPQNAFIATTRAGGGDIVEIEEARVTLAGHVRDPGSRSLASAPSLKALIGHTDVFRDDPYLMFGLIVRFDPVTMFRQFIPFSPSRVLGGQFDLTLQAKDEVRLFGFAEVTALTSQVGHQSYVPSAPASAGAADAAIAAAAPGAGPAAAIAAAGGARPPERGVSMTDAAVARLLAESSVHIGGEVRVPGLYPVVASERLADLIGAAGGASMRADLRSVEVTSGQVVEGEGRIQASRHVVSLAAETVTAFVVRPGDVVRVPPLGSIRDVGGVELAGEVWRPGRYELLSGERLSSVLARAGGLKPSAYPIGTVFTRQSVRAAEKVSYERVANELNSYLAATLTNPPEGADTAENTQMVQTLLTQIRSVEPQGRVVVEADPAVLQVRPELDIVLEGGDRLVVPSRPLHVMVAGEVLNPGAQQFISGTTARGYVDAAGGTTQFADTSRVYMIIPNGQAHPIGVSAWNVSAEPIPPGSTIVVPRDLKPVDFLNLTTALTDILSKLALSAASIAVIGTR